MIRRADVYGAFSSPFATAAQLFEQTIAADPENADALLLLGMADFELDRREASMKVLHQALKLDALRAARAHIYLANIYARGREYMKAADELHAYLEAVPADPEAAELKKVEARWRAAPPRP